MNWFVGRVDGMGNAQRFSSKVEAVKARAALMQADGLDEADTYLDGPPEKSEAEELSELLIKIIQEEHNAPDNQKFIDDALAAMERGDKEAMRRVRAAAPEGMKKYSDFVLSFANTLAAKSLAKVSATAVDAGIPVAVVVSLIFELGMKVQRARSEQDELAKML